MKKGAKEPLRCDVTQEEADGFDNSVGYPCTADNFRLHLRGTPAHKWNRAAAEVFTKSFLQERPGSEYEQVREYFITHIRTLITTFKKQEKLGGMREKERGKVTTETAAQTRRSTRKHNVSSTALVLHPPPLRNAYSSTTSVSRLFERSATSGGSSR